MKFLNRSLLFIALALFAACSSAKKQQKVNVLAERGIEKKSNSPGQFQNNKTERASGASVPMLSMNEPLNIDRREFVNYAKTLIGTPYRYGSANPQNGLDCSGLLFYIFQQHHVKSPRASYDYTNVGTEVNRKKALPGDIILFTGENTSKIGHMGIITENNKEGILFLHAPETGSRVRISPMNAYFEKHFVKVIRVLE